MPTSESDLSSSIDAASKTLIEITSLDNQVLSDHLKYSEWVLGISTAGFALIVGRFDKIIETSWLNNESTELSILTAACVLLICSAVSGAYVKIKIGTAMEFGRKRLSMVLQQNLEIKLGINENFDKESSNEKNNKKNSLRSLFTQEAEKTCWRVYRSY
ncbi:MAG: hypothetical protein ACN4GM_17070 [Gammaproteobacteria bacterium]